MKKLTSFFFLLSFPVLSFFQFGFAQHSENTFKIIHPHKKAVKLRFRFMNNIIVFPMQINGDTSLNFILDSGVESTLITNISYEDSVHFNSRELKRFYGLGDNGYFEAFKSQNNVIELDGIRNDNLFFYAIPLNIFDFSKIFKVKVQGIVGYDLLKDFIVEINYPDRKITFHDPQRYTPSRQKLKRYTRLPLEFEQAKPFVKATITLNDGKKIPVKLLIDTGGSFALWLSADSHKEIVPPKDAAMAYLGETLSGEFFGLQGQINSLNLGGHELLKPIAAFPDSTAISFIYRTDGRNGSIGTDILRRFHVIFDYPNKTLWIKPNHQFNDPYNINISGIELIPISDNLFFRVTYVEPNSPAYLSGIRENDMILQINDKLSKDYGLHEVYDLFRKSVGRTIKFQILRDNILPIRKISVFFPNKDSDKGH